ncbi:tRNA (guanine(46)-N(7))-methyltransferase TrmB [Flocculibacter collagenilyticus]|uniref:tRNA (guanine(46)-N(7))-methyltransferase TrmB n=1 Tax=Flocculibacter collagenilyticus TaxID=2744479 RepID=UPI001F38984C|nr:SAM-dependent methyltransferase [Flocculibacter collagenilyticus]
MIKNSDAQAQSRRVISNQDGVHEDLAPLVKKYLSTPFKKPYSQHTLNAFNHANQRVQAFEGPIILDSCCGVGASTINIAKQHPHALVIGIDKSEVRIEKHQGHVDHELNTHAELPNYMLARADLNDFWRLAVEAGWKIEKHFLLYPNPWPKAKHIKRRWHGSAVFPYIVKLGGLLEVRSNWQLYIEEFAVALSLAGVQTNVEEYQSDTAITPFEKKYWESGQQTWRIKVSL